MTHPLLDDDTAALAVLRDDIAHSTHPDEPVAFTSDLICALLDEVIRLRIACAARPVCSCDEPADA